MEHAKFAKQNTSHSGLRMFLSILLVTGSSIIWNCLPDEVVEAVTMNQFKQLFDVYIAIVWNRSPTDFCFFVPAIIIRLNLI